MNWNEIKQIINVIKLKLYSNFGKPKEKIFSENNFDINWEYNKKKDKIMEIYEVKKIQRVR
jgi:hypothetical protein